MQAYAIAAPHSRHFSQRINDRFSAAETDDFRFDFALRKPIDFDNGSDGRRQARDRGRQPFGAHDAARHRHWQHRIELCLKRIHD
jgi:hypothetical protein